MKDEAYRWLTLADFEGLDGEAVVAIKREFYSKYASEVIGRCRFLLNVWEACQVKSREVRYKAEHEAFMQRFREAEGMFVFGSSDKAGYDRCMRMKDAHLGLHFSSEMTPAYDAVYLFCVTYNPFGGEGAVVFETGKPYGLFVPGAWVQRLDECVQAMGVMQQQLDGYLAEVRQKKVEEQRGEVIRQLIPAFVKPNE